MQKWRTKKSPYNIQYEVIGSKLSVANRKNSDICPWDSESTNQLIL